MSWISRDNCLVGTMWGLGAAGLAFAQMTAGSDARSGQTPAVRVWVINSVRVDDKALGGEVTDKNTVTIYLKNRLAPKEDFAAKNGFHSSAAEKTVNRAGGSSAVATSQVTMTVLVHDFVGIDEETMRLAEGEADDIFRQAGVEVGWRLCFPASKPPATECPASSPSTPYLRLVPRFRSVKGQVPADSGGYSIGNMMTVSWEEAENAARSGAGAVSEVLGLIIAHEFGHLLLGGAHSVWGIMRARWGSNDWQLAQQGRLVFLRAQAAHLRRELRSRSLALRLAAIP